MNLYGFLWILVWNFCRDFVWIFGMNFCIETCLGVWNTSFFFCRILVWNDCLVWLWSSMEEKFV